MKRELISNGVHDYTEKDNYVYPQNPEVAKHLEWFRGLKLGFMMHWSPASQLGTYESWPLSDGDAHWSRKDVDWTDAQTFKQQYRNANQTFQPVKFRPDQWAELAKDCGFQYLLFTTKHHDGFCMYDTQTTNYKITDPSCPFHSNPNADITGALYREFKKRGMGISVYFSKPDWNSPAYWNPAFGEAKTRNVNYEIKKHPELWESYVDYVHRQITELCTNYGKVDVLWLDGGWVRPDNFDQDIRLNEIVSKIRSSSQPHLIVCDRTVGGEFENIVTPEKTIPAQVLTIPWETCITLGDYFSFHYQDHYKSGLELVHILLEVVAKGGNLALNTPPQPDGNLPIPAVQALRELGQWLSIFGEGIYQTTVQAPYFDGRLAYTQKENSIYAFYLYDRFPILPAHLVVSAEQPIHSVTSLRTKETLPFVQDGSRIEIDISQFSLRDAFFAEGFRLE